MKEKVLVIQTAFIGDAILASSMLETIHREKPDAEIHFLVRAGNEVLYNQHPFIQQLWVWDKKKKYQSLYRLYMQMRKQHFTWLFCAQRFGTMGMLSTMLRANNKVGFSKNPWIKFFTHSTPHPFGDGQHEITRNNALLKPWLGSVAAAKPKLHFTSSHLKNTADLRAKEYVCLFPGSVWATKQLPVKKWLDVLKNNPKTLFYLMGAPSDKELCDYIIKESSHSLVKNLCGELNLMESAVVVRDALDNLVNDSAPLHLASATNANVTSFFCSTIPKFGFGPLSTNQRIIEIQTNLPCRPCGLHGKKNCPLGHFNCGNHINVEEIRF